MRGLKGGALRSAPLQKEQTEQWSLLWWEQAWQGPMSPCCFVGSASQMWLGHVLRPQRPQQLKRFPTDCSRELQEALCLPEAPCVLEHLLNCTALHPNTDCKYVIQPGPEWREGGCLPCYYAFSLGLQERHCVLLYFYWMKTENICK